MNIKKSEQLLIKIRKGAAQKNDRVHVFPYKGKWIVKQENNSNVVAIRTRASAAKRVAKALHAKDGVFIHQSNGDVLMDA
jgi:hypothetical protein